MTRSGTDPRRWHRPARAVRMACLLLGVGCVVGCASPTWKDRWRDAGEIFEGAMTTGPGAQLNLRVTELAQVGIGGYDGHAAGWISGRGAVVREQQGEFGVSLLHSYTYRREGDGILLDVLHPRWADPGFEEYLFSPFLLTDRQDTDIGFAAHLAVLGVRATFRPAQLIDFVAGLFGHDYLGDDVWSPSRDTLLERARSQDAETRARAFDALLRRGEEIHGYGIYTVPDVQPAFQRRAVEALESVPTTPSSSKPRQTASARR